MESTIVPTRTMESVRAALLEPGSSSRRYIIRLVETPASEFRICDEKVRTSVWVK